MNLFKRAPQPSGYDTDAAAEDDDVETGFVRPPLRSSKPLSFWRTKKGIFRLVCAILTLGSIGGLFILYSVAHPEKPCLIGEKQKASLTKLIHTFDELMTKYHLTHWIDYGTLLGAYRYEGVIPWDQDGDVGFLVEDLDRYTHNVMPELAARGIIGDMYMLRGDYNVTVDVFVWQDHPDGVNLQRYFNRWDVGEDLFNAFPKELVMPTTRLPFEGRNVSAPNDPKRMFKLRYPMSYNKEVSFLWDCYMPWNWFNDIPKPKRIF